MWPPRALPPLPGVPCGDEAPPYDDAFVERFAFSPEGVDRTLIWESLHRTPSERLAVLQGFVDGLDRFAPDDPPTDPADAVR